VGFVDSSAKRLWRSRMFEDISLFFWRVPKSSFVYWRNTEVLSNSSYPGRDALLASLVVGDNERYLDLGIMRYGCLSILSRYRTSQTPKSSFVIGVASRSQLLKSPIKYARRALGAHSRYTTSPFSLTLNPNFSKPFVNFSIPPSVSLIVLIHCCALLYLLRRASLNGDSQGSS